MFRKFFEEKIYPHYHNLQMLHCKKINTLWWDKRNWGDALNPVLIRSLSGLKPFQFYPDTINPKNEPIYTVIGSILGREILTHERIVKNTVVWGTGFIAESERLFGIPRQVCAVRGPFTRENLLKTGIKCPEVYGDPALLYPRIYKPTLPKKYKLGIIPHYADKGTGLLKNFKNIPEIRIIDIEDSINMVVDQICSCQHIASSSLHGIIASDAYGIPSVQIKFSDNVYGGNFKFRDYFGSVRRTFEDPLIMAENTTIDDIFDRFTHYRIDIELEALLDACPFYNRKCRQ